MWSVDDLQLVESADMSSGAVETVTKMLESLPETAQDRVIERASVCALGVLDGDTVTWFGLATMMNTSVSARERFCERE